MRILVIEDDEKIAAFISRGLKENGYSVKIATDGLMGQSLAEIENYDAIVVDVSGEIQDNKISTPAIFLSAKSSVDDRIAGLQAGGDDYLGKPFAISELTARIQALIRRSSAQVSSEQTMILQVADLTLNLLTREVYREGKKIELQAREFSLLEYLMKNAGRCVTKTLILEHVWDYNFDPQTNVVDVLVCRLRNKIDKNFKVPLIHTLRGMGYVLKED